MPNSNAKEAIELSSVAACIGSSDEDFAVRHIWVLPINPLTASDDKTAAANQQAFYRSSGVNSGYVDTVFPMYGVNTQKLGQLLKPTELSMELKEFCHQLSGRISTSSLSKDGGTKFGQFMLRFGTLDNLITSYRVGGGLWVLELEDLGDGVTVKQLKEKIQSYMQQRDALPNIILHESSHIIVGHGKNEQSYREVNAVLGVDQSLNLSNDQLNQLKQNPNTVAEMEKKNNAAGVQVKNPNDFELGITEVGEEDYEGSDIDDEDAPTTVAATSKSLDGDIYGLGIPMREVDEAEYSEDDSDSDLIVEFEQEFEAEINNDLEYSDESTELESKPSSESTAVLISRLYNQKSSNAKTTEKSIPNEDNKKKGPDR